MAESWCVTSTAGQDRSSTARQFLDPGNEGNNTSKSSWRAFPPLCLSLCANLLLIDRNAWSWLLQLNKVRPQQLLSVNSYLTIPEHGGHGSASKSGSRDKISWWVLRWSLIFLVKDFNELLGCFVATWETQVPRKLWALCFSVWYQLCSQRMMGSIKQLHLEVLWSHRNAGQYCLQILTFDDGM